MRPMLYACLLLAGYAPAWGQSAALVDRLGEALGLVGFTRADLGHRPKGYWSRYPNPQQMAGKLPFYDDLFAEPLRVYDYTRLMGMAAADYLSPHSLAEKGDALYQLVYFLGVDRRISGFRPYGANLDTLADPRAPLRHAIETVYARTGAELAPMAFGTRRDDRLEDLDAQIAGLDTALQRPLAILVLNVLDAYQWRQQALRRALPADLQRVFRIRDLSRIVDERVYHPEMDDLARDLDEQSLYYAGLKAVQAADDARRRFAQLAGDPARDLRGVRFDFETPVGRVVLAGSGDDVHRYADAAVLVDLGGRDRYLGPVGATPSLDVPISVAIDCAGDDTYEYAGDAPAQGAGILGVGVLIDQAGNDTYQARHYAQGLGFFGLGLLFDREGDDRYSLEQSGQGAGYFGVGCHFDGSGDDRFDLYGDGQGFGGVGGVGVLANHSGDDQYAVETLAEKAGRPDYHSQGRIAYSTAQGAGVGRRGDGSDGHNWAGGLGVLLDLSGRDAYEAGNFCMGFGYMYGTGLLYDGGGDDLYRSVYFTQASGAHFSIGALIDNSGNDRHVLYDTGGAGLAFGWDFAVALLVDQGGNDLYQARGNSLGRADLRSDALFVDLGGDDQYVFPPQAGGLGIAPFQPQYRTPGYSAGPYAYYAGSFALMLDIGGQDRYLDYDPATDAKTPSSAYGNDRVWQQPGPGTPEYGYRNFGVGMDVPDGAVPELSVFDDPVGE
jgi:hypothetical protein